MTEIPPTWRNAIDDIVPRPDHARRPEPSTLPHHPDDEQGWEEGGDQTNENPVHYTVITKKGGGSQNTTSAVRMAPEEKEEKETMEEKLMCPRCGKNPSPGRRVDNAEPKICKQCKGLAMLKLKGMQKSVKPAQNIPKNIPPQSGSEKVDLRDNQMAETFLAKTAGLDVLTRLQGELEQKIREARRIHTAMITVRDLYGVDFKIEALSLVG